MSTNSLSFPQMFDTARNTVAVLSGDTSILNRTRLLLLTEQTELYNSLNFGVGLKRYIWQYNVSNVRAMIQDRIVEQLRLHEPCVDPDKTSFADGLLVTEDGNTNISAQDFNKLKMTVGLSTIYTDRVDLDLSDLSETYKYEQGKYDIGGNPL